MTYVGQLLIGAMSCVSLAAAAEPPDPQPLIAAHAHNDYHHDRPLQDALDVGFCSIEVDVFEVGGDLLVAHDRSEIRADRTLQRLYLDPLRQRVARRGGRVYRDGPHLTLLVDFKSAAAPTYAALSAILEGYASLLVRTINGQVYDGPVQVVISGNRPFAEVAAAHRAGNCLVTIDGRLKDLKHPTAGYTWVSMISDCWTDHFDWSGEGRVPAEELERIGAIVARAHAQQRRVRFWDTPERTELWNLLQAQGVDLINTDDLAGLAAFLRQRER